MVELKQNELAFSFPEVHPQARLVIGFQRTLRIPDDGRDYPLPAGLGHFPMAHVDDCSAMLPRKWVERGGVMLPMWRAEAMWIQFSPAYVEERWAPYPFAVKIAAGKINAVTGAGWSNGLNRNPQDYVVAPPQPWLDGFCVERGVIRQFVAMPLGEGYSAEEQVTGKGEFGGLQIIVYPMRREAFERRFEEKPDSTFDLCVEGLARCGPAGGGMGMGLGGRMRQEIAEDPYREEEWESGISSRCFVHLVDARAWRGVTGEKAPTRPPTPKEYARAGIPWFNYYDEGSRPLNGSEALRRLKSLMGLAEEKGEGPALDEGSMAPGKVVELRRGLKPGQVREGEDW